MRTRKYASNTGCSRPRWSLRLVATVACLWPVVAVAGPPNPTGSDSHENAAAGQGALYNVTGFYNTAIGHYALYTNTTGDSNTANGNRALVYNTTGSYNTAAGQNALFSNATGDKNTANGAQALFNNTSGDYNTGTGFRALFGNTQGTHNTATGGDALLKNTNGNYNTATGGAALYSNTTGGANVAEGAEALYGNTTGYRNTAFGYQALTAAQAGISNVAVGYRALFALTAGGGNIALGPNAGALTKTGSNNIYIGNYGIAGTETNVTRIGRTQTRVYVKGIAGVPVSGATVVIRSDGQLGVVASSARYKEDIKPLGGDLSERLAELRPVSFSYKTEPGATHYGLIAEEVDKVMPELVVRDEENRPESVQYLELIPLLLQERQELRAELTRQRELIEQLQRTLDTRLAVIDRRNNEDVASLKQ